MSDGFAPQWWEAETVFTDEQLQSISKPLKLVNAQITQTKARIFLERIARRHGELRSQPGFGRSDTRKRLERISKLSAQLQREIFGPLDNFLDVDLANAHFHGEIGRGSKHFFCPISNR